MDWRQVWILYQRELRAALRERSIVVNSLLLPVFLYPVILWLALTGITLVEGVADDYVSRVAVFEVPGQHGQLVDSLRARDAIQLFEPPAPGTAEEARSAVRSEELDAVLEFLPPVAGGEGLPDDFRVRISYDRSETRSRRARDRVSAVVEGHRSRWIEEEGRALGLTEAQRVRFRISRENVASGSDVGAFLLSEMVPVFLVVMVALGCFVPAIDSTAGERERKTWETLMTVSASRTSIVTAKYFYVATLGAAAGVLNVLAMSASVGAVLRPILGGDAAGLRFEYPPAAVPVMVAGAVLLALFFAAAMMILASFARTFRDGQSMVTPVYWLALVPVFLGSAPDQRLTPELALVPIANVTLMIRDAIQGVFSVPLIAESFAVGAVTVTACIWTARWILGFEDVLLGSFDGSFWRFLRERGRR